MRKAIEGKDMTLLMEIRDTQFELLVSSLGGGATPLLYSMRMGNSRPSFLPPPPPLFAHLTRGYDGR